MNKKNRFFLEYLNLLYSSTYMPMHYIKKEEILAV